AAWITSDAISPATTRCTPRPSCTSSAPSTSRPTATPLRASTLTGRPMVSLRASQRLRTSPKPCDSSRQRHASNSSSSVSSSASRSGARPVSIATEVARSASSAGKARCARFTPTPVTIVTAVGGVPIRDSTRMPAILRPCARTSFGHFSPASMPVARRSASATATAVAIENVARSVGATLGRIRIEASRLIPGASVHVRPRRPRPDDWWSATTTVRSGAPSAASANAVVCVDSTTEKRTIDARLTVTDPVQARGELRAARLLGGEPFALARDDLGRGAVDEIRAGELRPEELDALGDSPDLLLEPRALRGEVDDPGQRDVDLRARHDGEGRVRRPARVRIDPEPRARQGVNEGAGGGEERLGAACRTQRGGENHAGRNPHLAADVADRGHDVHDGAHLALRGRVVLLPHGLRVGRDHDRLALVRQPLPDLLRDERHERVQKTQRRLEHLHQRVLGPEALG